MKRVTFLCIFLLSVCISNAFGISTTGPHVFTADQCRRCHISVPAEGQKGPFQMTAPVSELCRKCHESGMRLFSHPVDLIPQKIKVPPGFPLSYDGNFTCSTCHDIHAEIVGPFGFRSYYLRHKIGEGSFCAICHDRKSISHETLLPAHMKENRTDTRNSMIDEVSNQCLACHDGVTMRNAAVGLPLCVCPDDRTNHPIGVYYALSRMKTGSLKPLDKTFKLFNGKIGCGSCHDPYSKNSKFLVMPNTGSALCLKCHTE